MSVISKKDITLLYFLIKFYWHLDKNNSVNLTLYLPNCFQPASLTIFYTVTDSYGATTLSRMTLSTTVNNYFQLSDQILTCHAERHYVECHGTHHNLDQLPI